MRAVEIEFLEKLLINQECSTSQLESFSWDKNFDIIADHHLTLRRYSDPCVADKGCDTKVDNSTNVELQKQTPKPLKRCFSSISFMHINTSSDQDQDAKNLKQNGQGAKGSEDNVSVATTCTNSTVDSFEIALAIGAKHSDYVSPGNKELLHNLFVSIAGKWGYYYLFLLFVCTSANVDCKNGFVKDLNFKRSLNYSFKQTYYFNCHLTSF